MKILDFIRKAFNENPFKSTYEINRMRPPGAVKEELFIKLCVRCARCIEVCPYKALKRSKTIKGGNVGTPFIYAEETSCQLCMKCTSVCPTGAIDSSVTEPEQTAIGKAVINDETCHNFIYARQEDSPNPDATASICSHCYNVCPLKFKAIYLKDAIYPTITDKCTGCGLCVEICPSSPKSVYILPKHMQDASTAGYFYYLKQENKRK